MPPLRLRVSHLDQFRAWKENEDADLGWLLASLCERQPTEEMLRGIAFHLALEKAENITYNRIKVNGFTFVFDCAIELSLPRLREIRRFKDYGGIEVTGKVDTLCARTISDHKTTSYFDPEGYFKRYAWRYYLDIFNANRFVWNIFEMEDIGDPENPRTWRVKGFHSLEQYRYPDLERDCGRLALEARDILETYAPDVPIPISDEGPKKDNYIRELMQMVGQEIIP